MPAFKTTYNIIKTPWEDEAFDPKWMSSDELILPPKKDWDYKREMTIEDVSLWEVLYEASGGLGVYASWDPYAEFYLITTGFTENSYLLDNQISKKYFETYYGPHAERHVYLRAKEFDINLYIQKVWVDDDELAKKLVSNEEKIIIV
jgi:hypothetical protein